MLGHDIQGPYSVSVGISQGSTLLLILFTFFTLPLLRRFKSRGRVRVQGKYSDRACLCR